MTPFLNLESCPNQLSKFGELSKSALQIWLLSDSQKSPHGHLTDSWLTPNRLWSLFSDRQTSTPKTVYKKSIWWWHQVSIWRAVQISSPNLVTMYQTPHRSLTTDTQWNPNGPHQTYDGPPDWPPTDPQQTPIGSINQVKLSNTVKSWAVDQSTIQIWTLFAKVTVHKHQISHL